LYVNANSNTITGDLKKNFLLINAGTPRAAQNQTSYFAKPSEDSGWTNFPSTVKSREWIGIRKVMPRSGNHVMVKIEEMYPVTGRIWYNFYNFTAWTGWKSIVPS